MDRNELEVISVFSRLCQRNKIPRDMEVEVMEYYVELCKKYTCTCYLILDNSCEIMYRVTVEELTREVYANVLREVVKIIVKEYNKHFENTMTDVEFERVRTFIVGDSVYYPPTNYISLVGPILDAFITNKKLSFMEIPFIDFAYEPYFHCFVHLDILPAQGISNN